MADHPAPPPPPPRCARRRPAAAKKGGAPQRPLPAAPRAPGPLSAAAPLFGLGRRGGGRGLLPGRPPPGLAVGPGNARGSCHPGPARRPQGIRQGARGRMPLRGAAPRRPPGNAPGASREGTSVPGGFETPAMPLPPFPRFSRHSPSPGQLQQARAPAPGTLGCCHAEKPDRTRTMKTLLLVLLGAAPLLQLTFSLRIGAFNIRAFGDKKLSNQTISNFIARILTTYDLSLIQEVRDADLSAVKKLMNQINWASPDPYSYLVSKPLGRNSYKERYLFVYRQDRVSPVESYEYDDGCEPCGNDTFSREPLVVRFAVTRAAVEELILVPLHAAPEHAVAEIDALYDVHLAVKDKWGAADALLLGDFNAGCNYVRAQDWPTIRLRTSKDFQWLIPDTADTTVTNTACAYDRIVAVGAKLRASILPGTAKVDNFQKTFNLSTKDALAVSDHFPVEVTLKSA